MRTEERKRIGKQVSTLKRFREQFENTTIKGNERLFLELEWTHKGESGLA